MFIWELNPVQRVYTRMLSAHLLGCILQEKNQVRRNTMKVLFEHVSPHGKQGF